MMWNAGIGMAPWMWLVMGGGTVAFWVGVAYVVRSVLGGRWPRHDDRNALVHDARRAAPLDVLQDRLARGEIDVDEYARARRALVEDDTNLDRDRPPAGRR